MEGGARSLTCIPRLHVARRLTQTPHCRRARHRDRHQDSREWTVRNGVERRVTLREGGGGGASGGAEMRPGGRVETC